jgi:acetyl esterase/lipase
MLWMAGHSPGGTQATVAAMLLRDRPSIRDVVTFGQNVCPMRDYRTGA